MRPVAVSGTDSSLDASLIGELIELADTAIVRSMSMHDKNQSHGTTEINTGNNTNTNQIHQVEAMRSAPLSEQPLRGQAVHPRNSQQQTLAETYQTAPSQSAELQVQDPFDISWTHSPPGPGPQWVPQDSHNTIAQEGWSLQETSFEEQGREDELGGDPGEETGENNAPNVAQEVVGSTDCIINTINNSLLAAVKALTRKSHKREIQLELKHMMAQNVLLLDSKLNALMGKLERWDQGSSSGKGVDGSNTEAILVKISILPELLTSLIQYCKPAGETDKTTSCMPPGGKKQDRAPVKVICEGRPSTPNAEGLVSKEYVSRNEPPSMVSPLSPTIIVAKNSLEVPNL
ncbi:hypothetical protein NDU88_004508 [Pleurodeles waltl]|uniref:Uncharacterized protein n=1 Tax=Pleurodeles waltl TaxID=8319 RepID=A0AAV7VKL2_PLEWA|nr:hypothetical protein NDU88_004508 [Pleurodeles waltl]